MLSMTATAHASASHGLAWPAIQLRPRLFRWRCVRADRLACAAMNQPACPTRAHSRRTLIPGDGDAGTSVPPQTLGGGRLSTRCGAADLKDTMPSLREPRSPARPPVMTTSALLTRYPRRCNRSNVSACLRRPFRRQRQRRAKQLRQPRGAHRRRVSADIGSPPRCGLHRSALIVATGTR